MNSRDIAYHVRRKYKQRKTDGRNLNDRVAAEALLWHSNWQRHGEGINPVEYEQGYDKHKREPSREPRPGHRLNFNEG